MVLTVGIVKRIVNIHLICMLIITSVRAAALALDNDEESFMQSAQDAHVFDARGIARRFRHAAIFGALDALQPGEVMRFVNDHDPLPLLGQLQQRYGERLNIAYLQRESGAIVIDFSIVG